MLFLGIQADNRTDKIRLDYMHVLTTMFVIIHLKFNSWMNETKTEDTMFAHKIK